MQQQFKIIARIRSDFPERFGIPRQSGLAPDLTARLVMEPDYRQAEAFRGLEGFSHLWLLWGFSHITRHSWSPTVRPPRLGGTKRIGVFATRSPYRPNAIGLSSVRLLEIQHDTPEGPVLLLSGADLLDGTPIYDIKPYLAYTDSHPEASGGFTAEQEWHTLTVDVPPALLEKIPPEKRSALCQVLAQDPRGAWEKQNGHHYGMAFGTEDIRFTVQGDHLTVTEVVSRNENDENKSNS